MCLKEQLGEFNDVLLKAMSTAHHFTLVSFMMPFRLSSKIGCSLPALNSFQQAKLWITQRMLTINQSLRKFRRNAATFWIHQCIINCRESHFIKSNRTKPQRLEFHLRCMRSAIRLNSILRWATCSCCCRARWTPYITRDSPITCLWTKNCIEWPVEMFLQCLNFSNLLSLIEHEFPWNELKILGSYKSCVQYGASRIAEIRL